MEESNEELSALSEDLELTSENETTEQGHNKAASQAIEPESRDVGVRAKSEPLTVRDLLDEAVMRRSRMNNIRLRTVLTGRVKLELDGGKQRYILDWSGEELKIVEANGEADCTIGLSTDDFFQIVDGNLNPQIAMLSHKVKVVGKMELAVYFFNLFLDNR